MKTRERERARDVGGSETGEVDLRCAGRQAWRVREIGAVCHARASSFVRFGAAYRRSYSYSCRSVRTRSRGSSDL